MALYDFVCPICGKIEEHIVRYFEPKNVFCSYCGNPMIKDYSISRTGFQLKGKGWAKDGYTKEN